MVKLTVRQVPEGVLLLGAVLAGGRRDAGFLTPTVTKIWRAAQGEVGPVSQQHEELSDGSFSRIARDKDDVNSSPDN